ncbi:queuine tRNA-ribosyltransferase [Candidatus Rickettsiella viridis]|uniref:Queuine tRNA-ribosyltransferase n=1 Tax=Candidatus Rickettsiella viridis TaxID=676208 RepID=A0A2Z5UW57_9COXI|nr:tRNA guanosine(34) transglycosylase Tgt [Candidatus Rickettsiella viridis]BBB15728.1 queuine tRNA-ribosyltransferase [Candidatus Rickettsiella viridis]
MNNQFSSRLIKASKATSARVMEITTPHGILTTPTFMPVGTRAFVNHMTPDDLIHAGSQIILGGNTYHMLLNPGMDVIKASGGMHRLMAWNKPMLTDSGGFQVFSLSKNSKICRIDSEGAHFKHPINGKVIHLTPKSSIETQKIIGADIIMAFDECTPEQGGREAALPAMERTHRWLLESKETYLASPYSAYGYKQALFGIVQGGSFQDLREQSARFIVDADLEGIAIGGEVIGFNMQKTGEVIDWVRPLLPANKVRYTMGVGLNPQDLIDVVKKGIDLFDCVAPTRNARHGGLYHGKISKTADWITFLSEEQNGRLFIGKAIYAKDDRPILEGCLCYTCLHFSRAYLRFLFKQGSSLYSQLACIHNIFIMQTVCEQLRALILAERTEE